MNKRKIQIGGPGTLVAAAFIGPGTVTVCTLAGSGFGLELLWALLLSIFVTILFQDMSSKLGIITRLDLAHLIRRELNHPVIRTIVLLLVFCAIVIGNGAYEAGNISGGALGLDTFMPTDLPISQIIVGALAFALLLFGSYKLLERSLIVLVLLMSISFLATAILVKPDLGAMIQGLLVPGLPENGIFTVLGLIGTTIVPYNLFLHASLAKTKWSDPSEVKEARSDTIVSIAIGGLVSIAIVVTASSLQGVPIENAVDMGKGLEPIYGTWAKYLISLGLFAAGITSAITAPLAAAYVVAGCFGMESNLSSWKFRATWVVIIGVGVLFSSIGFKPVDIIQFAQVTNGLLLPIAGGLILWLSSRKRILGDYSNSRLQMVIGVICLILIMGLGIKSIWTVL